MRPIILLLVALIPAMVQGQSVTGPDKVAPGEAIQLHYAAAAGDVVRWTVLNPWPAPEMREIRSEFGTDFIVDPPCGWKGHIRVQCIATGADQRVKTIETKAIEVAGDVPDPDPIDPDPVDPDQPDNPPIDPPADEYTGPNAYGVGKIAFDRSPAYSSDVVTLFKEAAGSLYAQGGNRRVIYDGTNEARNKTEYNVFVWIRNEMARKGLNSPEWVSFYNAVDAQWRIKFKEGLRDAQWYDLFNEVAAGNEARK
jgi:hypothetical protein